MNYTTVLAQFETATLGPFTHREHILIAWLYLRRDGWEEGYRQIQAGIKHFAEAHGASNKYHETITRFWALLVQYCIDEQPDKRDFEQFISTFPVLLDKSAIMAHYSPRVLQSEKACHQWHEPDLAPLPVR